nr:hypothetical protein GCM10025730_03220 [Promicromonospora thailandica]
MGAAMSTFYEITDDEGNVLEVLGSDDQPAGEAPGSTRRASPPRYLRPP